MTSVFLNGSCHLELDSALDYMAANCTSFFRLTFDS